MHVTTNWILDLFCINNGVLLGRLQHELMTLMVSMDKGISAFPEGDNLFKWVGTLTGPATTVSVTFFTTVLVEPCSDVPSYVSG